MHNLFGDTNSVDVTMNGDGTYNIEHPIHGDTVEQVLRYVKFDPQQLLDNFRDTLERSELSQAEKQQFMQELSDGLNGYTYLE